MKQGKRVRRKEGVGESRDTKSSEEIIVNGRSDKEKEEVKKEIGKK